MIPPGEAPGLVLHDVSVRFGTRVGLVGVSLAVGRGERVVLLGPSGEGKTTLLRAIAGLDELVAGHVRVGGRDVSRDLPESRGVVYLHQRPSMFPHLSVVDNVGFPMEVRGIPRLQARERAMVLLERVQLAPLATRSALALSGGQQHRVAIARALAADPVALLLDEPFNALDPALRADVRDSVVESLGVAGGPSVLMVTHDVDEAAALGDRIAVLLGGRIVQDAPPAVTLSRPATHAVARFLGVPNCVAGTSDGRGTFTCALGQFACDLPAGRAMLVARADAMRAASAIGVADDRNDASPASQITATVEALQHRVGGTTLRVRLENAGSGDPLPLTVVAGIGALPTPGDVVSLDILRDRVHVVAADPASHV
ncbi:MAG TPA: ABC transporter ATP-binding protein [Gemmatimonas sp.]|nr:ABC transporter ATP-binding protein [Gemmatimonas sp.]